jgi:Fe-S cluster assembly protein SufD
MEATIINPLIIDLERSKTIAVSAAAQSLLDTMPWPTTRDEDWKYTRTGRITKEQWAILPINAQAPWQKLQISPLDAWQLVFINGQLDRSQSTLPVETGITIIENNSAPAFPCQHYFDALAQAYCTNSVLIRIDAKLQVAKSIHLIHFNDGQRVLSQPTIQIEVNESAHLHVVESFGSNQTEQSFGNRKLHLVVKENAVVAVDKIQDMNDGDFLMNNDEIVVERSAQFTINTLTIDGGWTRNQLSISLDGQGIEASINGCYMPRRNQLVDNHTKVDHRFAHCNSHELYKGLLDDSSTGVFNGKVYVHLDAQKTNAYQNNANILLSDHAQMNTKPELEIYADDVKCSHGTTTGQLDEEALFYLQSRGLSSEGARKLLTTAFITDVLHHVSNDAVRQHVINRYEEEGLLYV